MIPKKTSHLPREAYVIEKANPADPFIFINQKSQVIFRNLLARDFAQIGKNRDLQQKSDINAADLLAAIACAHVERSTGSQGLYDPFRVTIYYPNFLDQNNISFETTFFTIECDAVNAKEMFEQYAKHLNLSIDDAICILVGLYPIMPLKAEILSFFCGSFENIFKNKIIIFRGRSFIRS